MMYRDVDGDTGGQRELPASADFVLEHRYEFVLVEQRRLVVTTSEHGFEVE
jgi:hypothetical protein